MPKKQKTNGKRKAAIKVVSADSSGRNQRILYTMMNTSIIMMSTLMGGLTQALVDTTSAMASGLAEAFGGEELGQNTSKKINEKRPEIDSGIKSMISDMRKDIYSQIQEKSKELQPYISDPVFDNGPSTVEKYNFDLPKFTGELSEDSLAQYSQLLVKEDKNFEAMFKELAEWLNTLPSAPKKKKKTNSV